MEKGSRLASNSLNSVEDWINNLNDEKMPGFSTTVTDVTEAVNSEHTSAADVAQAILKDPSLTSRLLKMANSFFYNPTAQEINTVSRAVMVLGFDQVRALALSLVLIDNLVSGEQREKLTSEIALSFHAAVQAQEFAKKSNIKVPENVFVSTLLYRLGNMAFWAFSDDKAQQLLASVNSSDLAEEEIEQEILGFSLKDLTKGLSSSWNLGELLQESLEKSNSNDPKVNMIQLGQLVATAAKDGWDNEEAQQAISTVAKKLKLAKKDVEDMLHTNAKTAKKITKLYGITAASNQIPQASAELVEGQKAHLAQAQKSMAQETAADSIEQEKQEAKPNSQDDAPLEHPKPDVNLQTTILDDISKAIESKPSINIILGMVLEGLHLGVGMDRSLFAVLSPDRKSLTCKYAVGSNTEDLINQFQIDISNDSNIFKHVVLGKEAIHVPSDPKKLKGTLTRSTIQTLGVPPYLIMPTIVKGRVIGIYFADRHASKRQIEQKDFLAFQSFCQKANKGLTFLTTQG